jgi:hypothetical protein
LERDLILTFEVVGVRDELVASSWATGLSERSIRKITAESNVEDESLVGEELAHRARIGGEESTWRTPVVGIGAFVGDVLWDGTATEVPDANTFTIPERGIDTSTNAVHTESVAFLIRVQDTASSVKVDRSITFGGSDAACESFLTDVERCITVLARGVERAARKSVEGGLIDGRVLGTLDDINFSTCRPVVAVAPECGPHRASITAIHASQHYPKNRRMIYSRHLENIHDEKTLSVLFLAVDTDTVATLTFSEPRSVVDSHNSDTVLAHVRQTLSEGCIPIYIVDRTVSGIRQVPKVPVAIQTR